MIGRIITPLEGTIDLWTLPEHLKESVGPKGAMLVLGIADPLKLRKAEIVMSRNNMIDLRNQLTEMIEEEL